MKRYGLLLLLIMSYITQEKQSEDAQIGLSETMKIMVLFGIQLLDAPKGFFKGNAPKILSYLR